MVKENFEIPCSYMHLQYEAEILGTQQFLVTKIDEGQKEGLKSPPTPLNQSCWICFHYPEAGTTMRT